jgi:hypothetical protein
MVHMLRRKRICTQFEARFSAHRVAENYVEIYELLVQACCRAKAQLGTVRISYAVAKQQRRSVISEFGLIRHCHGVRITAYGNSVGRPHDGVNAIVRAGGLPAETLT